ncbi:hypothetical protein GCM10023085_49760 [Actinomadura viridis]|uniref:HEAT repeat protein n=1 Tax=Actinomadura viridis TaxID=58110 RepID=A0A931DMT7_9ACTN|nr:hypothetical protein [Actinomadura viridis]MBG6092437.1 hypothetical protein [Actinomadura viridis]
MSAPARSPLEGLETVDWADLHHAYGPATDVPGQLAALLSADAEERYEAHQQLRGNVYHQGTRWQASRHVVPFLTELVDDPATPDRAAVVDLLRDIALGDRDDTHLPFEPAREFARAENVTSTDVAAVLDWLYDDDGDGDEPEESDAVAVSWDRDAYLAAAAVSDRFAAWTNDPDPMIAAGTAELLVWFPATQPVVSRLMEIPAAEGRQVARASANLSLGYLAPDDPAVDNRLTDLLAAGTFGVQLTAAVALALRLGDRIPDAGLQVLAEARDHADEITETTFPMPWHRSLLGFTALALYRIGLSP